MRCDGRATVQRAVRAPQSHKPRVCAHLQTSADAVSAAHGPCTMWGWWWVAFVAKLRTTRHGLGCVPRSSARGGGGDVRLRMCNEWRHYSARFTWVFFGGGGGAFSVPLRMDREPFIDGDSAGGDNVRCYLSVFILN